MAEYIRREDAIKCIEGQCVDGKMWGNDESEGTLIEAYSVIDDLMEIPPADVVTVRHGRWETMHYEGGILDGTNFDKCSVCGYERVFENENLKPHSYTAQTAELI